MAKAVINADVIHTTQVTLRGDHMRPINPMPYMFRQSVQLDLSYKIQIKVRCLLSSRGYYIGRRRFLTYIWAFYR